MFEVPKAKRVKRSRIFSFGSASSLSEDEHSSVSNNNDSINRQKSADVGDYSKSSKIAVPNGAHEQVVQQDDSNAIVNYGFEYDFIDNHLEIDNENEMNPKRQEDTKEQTFDFQLFKSSSKSQKTDPDNKLSAPNQTTHNNTSRITIRSPTPESSFLGLGPGTQQSGSILKPRPQSHYFTTIFNDSSNKQRNHRLKSEYEQVAVTSEDVTNLSMTKWQGTHLAWRVIHIKPSSDTKNKTSKTSKPSAQEAYTRANGRPRPGKKRRIVMRRRVQMRQLLAEETKIAAQKADEAEREKRTRKNREKKVRKKEKEKRKKLETRPGIGVSAPDGATAEAHESSE